MTRGALVALSLHRRRHPKLVQLRYVFTAHKATVPVANRFAFARWAEEMLEERRQSITNELLYQISGVPRPFLHRAQDFGVMLG